MSRLALYLLGPPRIELDDQQVTVGRAKAVALLAYLAVTGTPHSREALATLLWPESTSSRARASLRRVLVTLRQALGEGWLELDGGMVGLRQAQPARQSQPAGAAGLVWLDVDAFRRRLRVCETHGHEAEEVCEEFVPLLEEAVGLYQDDFLAGFTLPDSLAFDEWQFFQAEGLRQALESALVQLVRWYRDQRAYESAISYARRWLALDPLQEPAHRRLMELYALAGQQTAALRQYELCKNALEQELGVPPSPETTELYQTLRVSETLRVSAPPHNLPPQSTPFVGREVELAELDALIADPGTRLITILGPGGIGKTRLALAVAERQLRHGACHFGSASQDPTFRDGVFFVPLARLTAADEMAPAVAEALGFHLGGPVESRTAQQQLLDFLREKRMLLLLDNFEHLLGSPTAVLPSGGETARFHAAGAKSQVSPSQGETEERERGGVSFVADVLGTAPEVQLLVTSRERLPLREEQAFPIIGLECADEKSDDSVEYAAARLFLQAARRAEPSFELATDKAASLSRICRLLEGMPLGIELAAAWVDVLPLADIAAEIQRGLDFLATEWQDAPKRHRSVRAAIDTSWSRLTETEQAAYAQLCVFRGGFAREAAKEVAGADLRTLARLVEKSLLRFSREQERYDVHELLRQYGCERLAADPEQEHEVRDRHSAYFCDAFGRWGDGVNRGIIGDVNPDFEADWANLQVASEWAADHGNAERLDLALEGLMYSVWWSHRYRAGERLFRCLIDALQVSLQRNSAQGKRVLAKAVMYEGQCNRMMDRWGLVAAAIQRSRALLEDPALAASDTRYERSWLHMLLAQQAVPDWETAEYHFRQALALDQELGYEGYVAFQMHNLSRTYAGQGRFDQARQFGETGLTMFRAMGIKHGILDMLAALADLAETVGDLPEAERLLRELRIQATEVGNSAFRANAVVWLGALAILQGKHDEAKKLLPEGRQLAYQCGAMNTHCNAVWLLGELAWNCGDVNTAERQWKEALRLAHQDHLPSLLAMAKCNLSYIACARGDFDRAEALCEEGIAGLREHELFFRAILKVALARVALFRGDTMLAVEQFHECLQELRPNIDWNDIIRALEGLSWALANLDRYGKTAQLLGFLEAQRERTGMILPPVDQPHHERALDRAREGLSEETLATAWAEGGALTLEEAVELALV